MIILTLPYPPSANRIWRKYRGDMILSKEAREYKRLVANKAAEHFDKPLAGATSIDITLHPRMNADGSASDVRIDLGNAEKVVSDAMNRVAWKDDKQHVRICKRLGAPTPDGSLVVAISECTLDASGKWECTEVAGLEW